VENSVEVRYAGVVVGRGALVKELGGDAIFVGIPEPLPVGTLVTLKIGDAVREARVDEVVESAEPSAAGMRVRFGGGAAAARPAPAKTLPQESAPAPAPRAPEPAAPQAAAPSVESGVVVAADSGPSSAISAEAGDEGSGAIPAPLSLAGGGGDGAQPGGGKRRRKRR
jgi:hypothetical protein